MACSFNTALDGLQATSKALASGISTYLAAQKALASAHEYVDDLSEASSLVLDTMSRAQGFKLKLGVPGLADITKSARKAVQAVTSVSVSVLSVNPSLHAISLPDVATDRAIAGLGKFAGGAYNLIDGFAPGAYISIAARVISDWVMRDESIALAYARFLSKQLYEEIDRAYLQMDDLLADTSLIQGVASSLFDGPWTQLFAPILKEAQEHVTTAATSLGYLGDTMEKTGLLDTYRLARAMDTIIEAEESIHVPSDVDLASITGMTASLRDTATAVQLIGSTIITVMATKQSLLHRYSTINELMGALFTLQETWPNAVRKAAKHVAKVRRAESQLTNIAEDIEKVTEGKSSTQFAFSGASWKLQLRIVHGQLTVGFNPITLNTLSTNNTFVIEDVDYKNAVSALSLEGILDFTEIDGPIKRANNAIPTMLDGVGGSSRSQKDRVNKDLISVRRAIGAHRRQLDNIRSAIAPLAVVETDEIDHILALVQLFRIGGWKKMLMRGRLNELLDVVPGDLDEIGQTIGCLQHMLGTVGPKTRNLVQALLGKLEGEKRVRDRVRERENVTITDLQKEMEAQNNSTVETLELSEEISLSIADLTLSSQTNEYATLRADRERAGATEDPTSRDAQRRTAHTAFFRQSRGLSSMEDA